MLTIKKQRGGLPYFSGLLFICAIILVGCGDPGARALLDGERLIKEGKYQDAIKRLTDAAYRLPDNAQARNYLGLAYHHAGNAQQAAEAYVAALRLNGKLAVVRYNLGCLYLEQNLPAQAVDELTSYTLLEPQNIDGFLKLGTAQLRRAAQLSRGEKTRMLDSAQKSFDASLKLNKTAEGYNGLGLVDVQKGRTRESLQQFNKALQVEPNYPAALLNIAIVNQRYLNDPRTALQKYREYLAAVPRSSEVRPVEEVARALDVQLSGGRSSTTAPVNSNRVAVSETNKPGTKAEGDSNVKATTRYRYSTLSRPASGNRTEALRLYNEGNEAQKAKNVRGAIAAFQNATKADPSFFEAHFKLGLLRYEAGDYNAALLSYEHALAAMPDSSAARYNFALALQKAGYAADAAQELEKILRQAPSDSRAHLTLAILYERQLGNIAAAREHYQKVLDLEPKHVQANAIRTWLQAHPK